ncbi:MAG: ATP-binding protein, partial [Cyclobacteriaceae bacterium]|nr:ATP-binding protein [Cyclobacteriaceae bacterium]
ILFFDEADALFGKRTDVKDAHDRYANQEVSYLLQRIEEYEGLAILATNLHSNIEKAFIRRFDSVVYFPLPKPPERKRLWEKAIPKKIQMAKELNVADLAEKYELTGSNIMNIVRYASLQATERQTSTINQDLLEQSIKKELTKDR